MYIIMIYIYIYTILKLSFKQVGPRKPPRLSKLFNCTPAWLKVKYQKHLTYI